MKILAKNITKWSSKKETYYTYHDKDIGEVKVIITECFDDEDNQLGVSEVKILKDDYCMTELVSEVYKIHYSQKAKEANK